MRLRGEAGDFGTLCATHSRSGRRRARRQAIPRPRAAGLPWLCMGPSSPRERRLCCDELGAADVAGGSASAVQRISIAAIRLHDRFRVENASALRRTQCQQRVGTASSLFSDVVVRPRPRPGRQSTPVNDRCRRTLISSTGLANVRFQGGPGVRPKNRHGLLRVGFCRST